MRANKEIILIILKRIPDRKHILPVYGLIVMFDYGWSLLQFFKEVPSWLKFLTLGEISGILAYTLAVDFLESLLILAGLIVISICLPIKWFHDDFIVRAGVTVLYSLGFFIFLAYRPNPSYQLNTYIIRGIIDLVFLHLVIKDVSLLRKVINSLADRSTVFLYLSIPASLLALVIVLYRNISGII